ncbi:hypothetical protein TNCV_4805501 [Trichonephila clavipes]|nr:hypothetical protein TNCV_4805501 [Trichonephila clavipes]
MLFVKEEAKQLFVFRVFQRTLSPLFLGWGWSLLAPQIKIEVVQARKWNPTVGFSRLSVVGVMSHEKNPQYVMECACGYERRNATCIGKSLLRLRGGKRYTTVN